MPSSTIRSISITVSDDDGAPAPRRAQRSGRRKAARGVGQRALRLVARWWPVLLLLPAVALLLFEASRLRASPDPAPPVSSLGRLDPTTRLVHGVREPCLKFLSPKSIEKLVFPEGSELDSVVKRIIYKSDDDDYDTYHSEANSTYLLQHAEATRFNLFTGFQTLPEREESFKVNETVNVHCGFYSDNGGFKISDDDIRYTRTCKVAVSTCAFGGGDDLYQPIGMVNSSIGKVCYVAFWDEVTLSTQEAEGKVIGESGMIGRWRIIVVKSLPFLDQRLNGKIPKMLSHRLFPEARYSIWVDSKYQFRRDPIGVLEALLWRTNSTFAISEHGARSSIYDEGKAIVEKHKATPEEVEVQLTQYHHDGMPDEKRLHGLKALSEASIIVRELTPMTNHFMCDWFNEVVRFTSRDQLSFPYVLWRLNMPGINMFSVCTRRDLVNSLGHTRKDIWNKTWYPKAADHITTEKTWYVVDATDKILGRLASTIAVHIRGKNEPTYTPSVDMGAFVVVVNAEKVAVSGKKRTQKLYRRHSGRPGGMKEETFDQLQKRIPERIVEHAVRGMLPKGRLGRRLFTHLKVYKGPEHPHEAQKPVPLPIRDKRIQKTD